MARLKGTTMTEEQKAAMKEKRKANKEAKLAADPGGSAKVVKNEKSFEIINKHIDNLSLCEINDLNKTLEVKKMQLEYEIKREIMIDKLQDIDNNVIEEFLKTNGIMIE